MTTGSFEQLLHRAVQHLRAANTPLTSAILAQAVAGATAASAPAFGRILERALGADKRFVQDDAGLWLLAEDGDPHSDADPLPTFRVNSPAPAAEQLGPIPRDVVVLHVETTGGRSEHARLLEVAAVRLCDGKTEATFTSLVNPLRRIPRHVWERLDLDADEMEAAPPVEHVLEDLRTFIRETMVAGHSIHVHLGQLNYEALWHGVPPFNNATLDLQRLGMAVLQRQERPSLDNLARALGLPRRRNRRAFVAVDLAVSVLLALGRHVRGTRELPNRIGHDVAASLTPEQSARYLRGLPPGAGQALPERAGIYLFRGATGEVLYAGKATNLRERVAQHFTGVARALRVDDGLLTRVALVEHYETGNELEALLSESRLIRELCPPYNTQQRAHPGRPFIRLQPGAFPRFATTSAVKNDAATYFGPYRNGSAASKAVKAVQRIFQIRTCTRTLPAKRSKMRVPCLRLGQGLCPAPCAEQIAAEHYDELVRFACQFLTAGRDATLDSLDLRLRELAVSGEQQSPLHHHLKAARSRLLRVKREDRPLAGGFAGGTVAMVYPDADGQPVAYVVQDGRLVARRVLDGDSTEAALAEPRQTCHQTEPLLDMHQTNILLRWIYQHTEDTEILTLGE